MHEIPQSTEHAIAHLCKIVRVLSDDRVKPAAIHLRHARIGAEAGYEQHLGQIPRFGSNFDGIVMRSAEIRLGVSSTNTQLQDFVERYLVGVAPPFDISLTEQVRETLKNLARVRQPNLGDVSRVLRIQPRTLQRRLKDAGEKFEILQDQVRREEAEVLFRQPAIPLSVVAQTLGFNDQAALNRACRRWFGLTPRQKRVISIGVSEVTRAP